MRVVLLAVTTPSCALLASGNASHNSRGTSCVDNPTFAVVDLIIAGGITAGLAGSGTLDKSPGWMLLPAVFATSGVVGAIFAARCAGEKEPKSPDPYKNLPVSAPYKLPENPPQADVPDLTFEERTEFEPVPVPPPESPKVKLTLDRDYKLPDPPPKPPKPEPTRIECDAKSPCPESFSCDITPNARRGHCVRDTK